MVTTMYGVPFVPKLKKHTYAAFVIDLLNHAHGLLNRAQLAKSLTPSLSLSPGMTVNACSLFAKSCSRLQSVILGLSLGLAI